MQRLRLTGMLIALGNLNIREIVGVETILRIRN